MSQVYLCPGEPRRDTYGEVRDEAVNGFTRVLTKTSVLLSLTNAPAKSSTFDIPFHLVYLCPSEPCAYAEVRD